MEQPYGIEVYVARWTIAGRQPDKVTKRTAEHPEHVLESPTPFGSIAVGDEIHPIGLTPGTLTDGGNLRVVRVEHVIWQDAGRTKHKIMLFTEEAEEGGA